jgi:hypothetical protein
MNLKCPYSIEHTKFVVIAQVPHYLLTDREGHVLEDMTAPEQLLNSLVVSADRNHTYFCMDCGKAIPPAYR